MPNAKKVQVAVEGKAKLYEMTMDADHVWSVTTDALSPAYYGYTFFADGEACLDILNPMRKPNLIWQSNMFLIPGNPPEPWEVRDVPHGVVRHVFYKSAIVGDNRDYFVYTPPSYEKGRHFPVLYLLHGYSDSAEGWTTVGMANVIMDNLIADGKIKPMVVVMPLGYGVTDFARPGSRAFRDVNRTAANFTNFEKALLTEVIPQVESNYKVSRKPKDRAIAGLSMGGAESLLVGLNHVDEFGYIGAFSAGGLSEQFASEFAKLNAADANRDLKNLFISCGTEDGLIGFNRRLKEFLKGQGVSFEDVETPGMHEWPVWRKNLVAFSEELFNSK